VQFVGHKEQLHVSIERRLTIDCMRRELTACCMLSRQQLFVLSSLTDNSRDKGTIH